MSALLPVLLPVLAAILATIVGGIVQIYIARRHKKGSIDTSEAAEVWAARKELTTELREELKRVQESYQNQIIETESLRDITTTLRIELAKVREESEITKNSMAALRRETGTMRIRLLDLERQLEDCRRWLKTTVNPEDSE